MLDFARGYRTYTLGVLAIIYVVGGWLKWWPYDSAVALGLIAGEGMALRAAIK